MKIYVPSGVTLEKRALGQRTDICKLKGRIQVAKYVLALDQGTTSSRAIVFDKKGSIIAKAQKEFDQIYPAAGWVEHDPMEILFSQFQALTSVFSSSGVKPEDIAAIGITNQRETTIMWDRETGKPVYNNRGTQLDAVFKVADGEAGTGDYRFYENQNYFIAWGGNPTLSTPRVLRGEVVLVALTYTITDSANYGLTVKSGSFKACYSGDKAMTDPYTCKVRTGDVMKGDVNGDGKIKMNDVMAIYNYLMGNVEFSNDQFMAADVTNDGKIKMNDVMKVYNYVMGDIDSLD